MASTIFYMSSLRQLIKSFHLRFFDRVGILYLKTYDLDIGWDGSFHNQVAPNGVYVYLIEAECPQTLEKIYLHGDITLIR
ncbi:MAG: gliding motility-associated C-terminal domain-containing protein [Saprospiraceae bacterium]|nr:gliding motility-associated C-terminal domain-containing protein [Saprospiraceae bacterium]